MYAIRSYYGFKKDCFCWSPVRLFWEICEIFVRNPVKGKIKVTWWRKATGPNLGQPGYQRKSKASLATSGLEVVFLLLILWGIMQASLYLTKGSHRQCLHPKYFVWPFTRLPLFSFYCCPLQPQLKNRQHRITSYNVCYTKLLRWWCLFRRVEPDSLFQVNSQLRHFALLDQSSS